MSKIASFFISFFLVAALRSAEGRLLPQGPVVEHPGTVLAAVELTLLVDGVIRHTEGGAFPTLGTDYRVAFQITLMCHSNMFLLFI